MIPQLRQTQHIMCYTEHIKFTIPSKCFSQAGPVSQWTSRAQRSYL